MRGVSKHDPTPRLLRKIRHEIDQGSVALVSIAKSVTVFQQHCSNFCVEMEREVVVVFSR